mmetsp:Transcript_18444/g.21279  ORF Transcript_18444/g.21279 Transcript_18444/m.21279 type:complete len:82 (+) Transcript_18444:67-312(+)
MTMGTLHQETFGTQQRHTRKSTACVDTDIDAHTDNTVDNTNVWTTVESIHSESDPDPVSSCSTTSSQEDTFISAKKTCTIH